MCLWTRTRVSNVLYTITSAHWKLWDFFLHVTSGALYIQHLIKTEHIISQKNNTPTLNTAMQRNVKSI